MTDCNSQLRVSLLERLRQARALTDALFDLVHTEALYLRPIAERHRLVFYLGHLEAFDWNMACLQGLGMTPFHPGFDRLFAFGIDPVDGRLPDDAAGDWPGLTEILQYREQVRRTMDRALATASLDSREDWLRDGLIFRVAVEHRLMHAETLCYLLHWLPHADKLAQRSAAPAETRAPAPAQVDIPAGAAMLGLPHDADPAVFGWDNEFQAQTVAVPAFSIDAGNVTNGQFLDFVRNGGYEERELWDTASWDWLRREGIGHPKFWTRRESGWSYRSMFADIPLPLSWPVFVSHAEASAYARWRRRALPTEAQYHRAAFGAPPGITRAGPARAGREAEERAFPWGSAPPDASRGNFDFARWEPAPAGSFPAGDSAFGVADLMGNGWEWTATPFAPLPGFAPFPFYSGYSADFFDGRHYVMKGASPATPAGLLRRSFRNWFQPHYPNIYATFRCVDN